MRYNVVYHDVDVMREIVVDEFLQVLVAYLMAHKNEYQWAIYQHNRLRFCPLTAPSDHNHVLIIKIAENISAIHHLCNL